MRLTFISPAGPLSRRRPLKESSLAIYILLANFLLRLGVSDITCGFKCYRKRSVQTIFSRQWLNNWSFDAENIFVALKHGYRLKEIAVAWEHTPGSKVKVLKNVIICGFDLLRIRLNDLKGIYV